MVDRRAIAVGRLVQPFLGDVALEGQLALLMVDIEDDYGRAFGERVADTLDARFQRCFVAIVGPFSGYEILDKTGQGVGFELVVGNEHRV